MENRKQTNKTYLKQTDSRGIIPLSMLSVSFIRFLNPTQTGRDAEVCYAVE